MTPPVIVIGVDTVREIFNVLLESTAIMWCARCILASWIQRLDVYNNLQPSATLVHAMRNASVSIVIMDYVLTVPQTLIVRRALTVMIQMSQLPHVHQSPTPAVRAQEMPSAQVITVTEDTV